MNECSCQVRRADGALHPAHGLVDDNEQVEARGLVGHLRLALEYRRAGKLSS